MSRSLYRRLIREKARKKQQLKRARKLCERLQDQVEELHFRILNTEQGGREYREKLKAWISSLP